MIRLGGRLVLFQVASASGASRQNAIQAADHVRVACLAWHRRVRSQQREDIEVIGSHQRHRSPSNRYMTQLAIRAELPVMNIGVATKTVLRHIRENRLRMTLFTSNFRVHTRQRIVRFIVIELGDSEERLPTCVAVATFAWHIELSMRTPRNLVPLR